MFNYEKKEIKLKGTPVSPGIVYAKAFVISKIFREPERYKITKNDILEENKRFKIALAKTHDQISLIQNKVANESENDSSLIFEAHLMILEDKTVINEVKNTLKRELYNIEYIFYQVIKKYIKTLEKIDDPYLRDRATDIRDVGRRVVRNLLGVNSSENRYISKNNEPYILISREFTPSFTANLNRKFIKAISSEEGSKTSHIAILAKSLNIPAIFGLKNIAEKIHSGDMIIIDGYKGDIIVNPTKSTISQYKEYSEKKLKFEKSLQHLRKEKAQTNDGKKIHLTANIELQEDVEKAIENGSDGIGLFRTEFFYFLSNKSPNEEEQSNYYTKLVEKLNTKPIIFRTLDIGGDKIPDKYAYEKEANPFLGWRSIRISLTDTDIFKVQLKAIFKASQKGNVNIMFPLITSLEEILLIKKVILDVKDDLNNQNISYNKNIKLGAMIEVPSAAIIADDLAKEVDFFSIGSNDLIQYTLAVDRGNEKVSHLFQALHPAVLKLIKKTVDVAKKHNIPVSICGEAASDILITPFLIGIGITEFSVNVNSLSHMKYIFKKLNQKKCIEHAEYILSLSSIDEIKKYCLEIAIKAYPAIMENQNLN